MANGGLQESLLRESLYQKRLDSHPNQFAKNYAKKFFSQDDEDGITLEIIQRIKSERPSFGGFFAEFGVGDGCENNTLVLLSMGWKGCWFGGQDLAFDVSSSQSLRFRKVWLNSENIAQVCRDGMSQFSVNSFDVVSLDLDGNDYYLVEQILRFVCKPSIFVCEYNGVFPLEVSWKMPYNPSHSWAGDHYFGCSLRAYVDLFGDHGYFLCACNPGTGVNAFFVSNEYRHLFPDVPSDLSEIYATPFYVVRSGLNHKYTPRFIRSIFN